MKYIHHNKVIRSLKCTETESKLLNIG